MYHAVSIAWQLYALACTSFKLGTQEVSAADATVAAVHDLCDCGQMGWLGTAVYIAAMAQNTLTSAELPQQGSCCDNDDSRLGVK